MDFEVTNKYLFIGGTGRSGTNITRKIFAQHPEVASFPFEYRFIIDPDGVVDFYQSMSGAWSPYMADVKIKRLHAFLNNVAEKKLGKENYHDWELAEWFPHFKENTETLIQELKTFDYQGFWPGAKGDKSSYQITFSEYKDKQLLSTILGKFLKKNIDEFIKVNEKSILVEDNTWNILFARELSEVLPTSKLLHLVRDPRDVIASFMEQRWCPSDFESSLKMYKSIIERWFDVESTLSKSFYKTVKLEDLVKNPEETLREICYFSGIPFEKELLEIALNKSNSGRWKKVFTKQNEQVIEEELGSIFEKLNYQL